MKILKVKYKDKEYNQQWQESQEKFPDNIPELCIFQILLNNFLDVKRFILYNESILIENKKALAHNKEYLEERKIKKINFVGKEVKTKEYLQIIKEDIQIISDMIQFCKDNYDDFKLTISL